MFYHEQCDKVINDFQKGTITSTEAYKKLEKIEDDAYIRIPNAEPDGDITFCVACALSEVSVRKS